MDDLISRAEALEAISDLYWMDERLLNFRKEIDEIVDKVRKLPSAEAQKGEWKPFDLTYGRNIFFCTACNNAAEVPTDFGKPIFKFCPWCGARMKGADNE